MDRSTKRSKYTQKGTAHKKDRKEPTRILNYEPNQSFHIVAFLGLVGCAAGGALTHYLTAIQNKSFTGNQKPALATKFSVIFAIFHTCATMEIPFFGWLPSRAEVCFIQFSVVAPILVTFSVDNSSN